MILLYIETKQYMYEDHDLEKALNAAKKAIKEGKAIQIIPGDSEGSSKAEPSNP